MNRFAIVAAVLGLLAAAGPVAAFVHEPYLSFLLTRLMLLAVAGIGLNLVLGYAGLASFGQTAFQGIGAYLVGICAVEALGSGWLQLGVAVAGATLAAAAIGAVSLRTRGIAFILITLAFGQMAYYAAIALERYGGDDGMRLPAAASLLAMSLPAGLDLYGLAFALLVGALIASHQLAHAPFGAVLRGAAANEERMIALGLNVARYRVVAFALSGALCGAAGALRALHDGYVSPALMNWPRSAELVAMVLVGGAATTSGPLLGAVVFTALEEVLSGWTDHWRIAFGAVLVLAALAGRGGIAAFLADRRE